MAVLLVDASSEVFCVLRLQKGEERSLCFPARESSQRLVAGVFSLLQDLKEPLEYLLLGEGPGSYTGLRIASIVLQSLSWLRVLPLIRVPSLLLYVSEEEGPYLSALDARGGGVYVQPFERCSGELKILAPAQRLSLEELSIEASAYSSLLSRDECIEKRLRELDLFPKGCRCISKKHSFHFLFEEADRQKKAGNTSSWDSFVPNYLGGSYPRFR